MLASKAAARIAAKSFSKPEKPCYTKVHARGAHAFMARMHPVSMQAGLLKIREAARAQLRIWIRDARGRARSAGRRAGQQAAAAHKLNTVFTGRVVRECVRRMELDFATQMKRMKRRKMRSSVRQYACICGDGCECAHTARWVCAGREVEEGG